MLSDTQYKELLKKGGWMVRNTYNFDQAEESEFWYIIKDSFGGFDELSSNERNKLRRSFKSFEYKIIEFELVKEKVFPIIKATFDDYKVTDRMMNDKIFTEYLNRCSKNQYDYWGAFDKSTNELVGFCAVHVWDNSCEFGIIGFMPEYKHNATYPYYGFFFKMTEYYLSERKFKYVTDGSRSITEHSNVQPFLEQNLKFRKAYCKLKVYYSWWLEIIVRVIYPFRRMIPNRSVKAVLMMHEMQIK